MKPVIAWKILAKRLVDDACTNIDDVAKKLVVVAELASDVEATRFTKLPLVAPKFSV